MESISSKTFKKTEIEVNLDLENSSLYVDGLKYELDDEVLDVIDSLITELNVLEIALFYNVGASINAQT